MSARSLSGRPSDLRTCESRALFQACSRLAAPQTHRAASAGRLSLEHPAFPIGTTLHFQGERRRSVPALLVVGLPPIFPVTLFGGCIGSCTMETPWNPCLLRPVDMLRPLDEKAPSSMVVQPE